jgi:hypothetical protein
MNNEKYVKLSKPIVRNGLDTLDELSIRIDHQKPSFNYFYGGYDKGGVYVYLTPVHRENGFVSQTIDGNTHNMGYKILIKELGRKSQKQIDIAVERIMPFAETIGEVYGEGNHQQVYNLIKNAYNSEY